MRKIKIVCEVVTTEITTLMVNEDSYQYLQKVAGSAAGLSDCEEIAQLLEHTVNAAYDLDTVIRSGRWNDAQSRGVVLYLDPDESDPAESDWKHPDYD
ncbi:MAG: hypothetical protein [Bacteriophage sp.]|nr:MAG: hypothetical protein [Bacteriophage sp.]